MITLYQFPPAFDLPVSVSPFCAKLEMYLRLTERRYDTAAGNPLSSPTRQVPYVKLPDGQKMADSGAIVAFLEAQGPALDADLTDAQRSQCEVLRATVEDQLYYAVLYTRFAQDAGFEHQKGALKAMLPPLIGPLLMGGIRKSQIKRCHKAGHTDDATSHKLGVDTVKAIGQALGDKPFILGDGPHVIDCAVWGPLLQAAATRANNPVTASVHGHNALMDFIKRMAERARFTLPTLG